MTGLKKVIQNSGIYLLGSVLGKSSLFFLALFLTRYYSTQEFGIWNYIFSISTVVASLGSLNCGVFFISKKEFLNESEYSNYLINAILLILLGTLSLSLLLFIFSSTWVTFKPPFGGFFFYFSIFALIIFNSLNNLFDSLLQASQKATISSLTTSFQSFFTALLTILLVLNFSVKWDSRFLSEICGSFLLLLMQIYFLSQMFKGRTFQIKYTYIKDLLVFLGPLFFHFSGFLIIVNFDKIMLGKLIDEDSVGIYSTSLIFGTILIVIYDGLIKAWNPFFFTMITKGGHYGALQVKRYIKAYYGLSVLGYFLYNFLIYISFDLLVGEEYVIAKKFIPIITLGAVIEGLRKVHANFFYLNNDTNSLGYLGFSASLINVLLNWFLIKHFQIWGCVFASFISYAILYFSTIAMQAYKGWWSAVFNGFKGGLNVKR